MQLIRYQPQTDQYTTHWLREPYDADGESEVVHLGELSDGYRYIVVPDTVTLPPQPPEVATEAVSVTPEVRKRLKDESPQLRLMAARSRRNEYVRFPARDIRHMELIRDLSDDFADFIDEVRNKNATDSVRSG